MKTKSQKIYVAEDGKEFFSKKECMDYENGPMAKLSDVQYFKVSVDPSMGVLCVGYLTELKIAVYDKGNCAYEHLLNYLYLRYGNSVFFDLECGSVPMWKISSSTREDYNKIIRRSDIPRFDEQIFLSDEPIEGFPPNIMLKELRRMKFCVNIM